ncbi:MAG: DUF2958 domain-containing protein [Rhodospirillaceae bacterium]|nr:DUF2958 domain-containing protein [Rhodospirillaceae bacterium]
MDIERPMKLMTQAQRKQLIANGEKRDQDHAPVVKWFTPDGPATWLVSELDEDGTQAFGLCDLGMGEPELGYISVAEIEALKGGFGLPVEREMYTTLHDFPMSVYAAAARRKQAITVLHSELKAVADEREQERETANGTA